jgi:hypothetical protein
MLNRIEKETARMKTFFFIDIILLKNPIMNKHTQRAGPEVEHSRASIAHRKSERDGQFT